jgi:hypothetical protein
MNGGHMLQARLMRMLSNAMIMAILATAMPIATLAQSADDVKAANPKAGRAEALQSAMIALMDDRSQADNAHPAVWAPFVVVGEGGDVPTRGQQRNKKSSASPNMLGRVAE